MDAMGDTAMTATDVTRNTAMPEGAATPPMIKTQSLTIRIGATADVASRATDVGSGEKTPTWTATVAPAEKEIATVGKETAVLPQGETRNGCRLSGR